MPTAAERLRLQLQTRPTKYSPDGQQLLACLRWHFARRASRDNRLAAQAIIQFFRR